MPDFGPAGVVIFHVVYGGSTFAFRIREDGTGMKKVISQQIIQIQSVSPDRQWVIAWAAVAGEEGKSATQAFPIGGGPPIRILGEMCFPRWQPDQKFVYLSVVKAMNLASAVGRTYVLPLPPGKILPNIPPSGFRSDAEIAAIAGVRVIDLGDVGPGPTQDVYSFSRQTVLRNLYRIPLP
jgi:hypothetical protein